MPKKRKKSKLSDKSKLKSLPNFFWKFLLFLIVFFILIGEKTKNLFYLFVMPLKLLRYLRNPFFWIVKFFTSVKLRYFLLGSIVSALIIFVYQSYYFVLSLPSPNNIGKVNYSLTTHLYDRSGRLLYEIYREQNRTPIKLKDLPSFVYEATIGG